jgi:hypothetical protein
MINAAIAQDTQQRNMPTDPVVNQFPYVVSFHVEGRPASASVMERKAAMRICFALGHDGRSGEVTISQNGRVFLRF